MKTRAWLVDNTIVLPIVVVVTGALSYWALDIDRVPPFSLTEGAITPPAVRGGEQITARWRSTAHRGTSYSSICTREIVDSIGTIHRVSEQEVVDAMPPADTFVTRGATIPFKAAWGRATYRQTCCYKINGISLTKIWPVCRRRPDLAFEILPTP